MRLRPRQPALEAAETDRVCFRIIIELSVSVSVMFVCLYVCGSLECNISLQIAHPQPLTLYNEARLQQTRKTTIAHSFRKRIATNVEDNDRNLHPNTCTPRHMPHLLVTTHMLMWIATAVQQVKCRSTPSLDLRPHLAEGEDTTSRSD